MGANGLCTIFSPKREVGVDPFPAIEHYRTDVPGRMQARVCGDQLFGDNGERTEVGVQRRAEVRGDERIPTRNDARDSSGGAPVDGVRSPSR
jgi:hypothetical protein